MKKFRFIYFSMAFVLSVSLSSGFALAQEKKDTGICVHDGEIRLKLEQPSAERQADPLDSITTLNEEVLSELSSEYEIEERGTETGDKVYYFTSRQKNARDLYTARAVYTSTMEDGNTDVRLWVELQYEDKTIYEGKLAYTGYRPVKVRGKLVSRDERFVTNMMLTCGGLGDTLQNGLRSVRKAATAGTPSVGTVYYFEPDIPYYYMLDSNAAISFSVSVDVSHTGQDYYTYEVRNYVGGVAPW